MKIRVRVSNEFERCSSLQMGLRDNIHLVLFLVFLLFLCLIPPVSSQPWDGFIVIQEDYQALREFKRELDDQNVVLRSWNDSGYGACSGGWLGIKCVKGQVIAIQLPRKGLRGRITEKIGQLTALRKLSLHDNSIGGSIPYSLGFLINLRGVYLFNNRLIGSIPPNIGNSPLLQAIDLSNNSLTGKIPDNISRSTKLYRINLSFNGFSGRIPVGLTTSPSLNFLSLEHNNLSGPIPDTWGGSTGHGFQLLSVNLNHNFLSGKIPSSISRLAGLEEINLGNNQINGSIPIEIGVLSRLKTLDFSHNFIGGALPTSICNLSSLVELKLDNNMIENHIPSDIDKLQNLSVLSLKRNRMDGQIPEKLGNLSKLKELDLSENKLTGGVTTFSKIIANLEFFNVSYNNLSGPVPLALAEKFNSSSFTGNIQLCGYNISVPCVTVSPPSIQNPAPSTPVESPRRKLGVKDIILIVAGCLLAILLVICLVLLFCLIRRRTTEKKRSDAVVGEKAEIAAGKDGEGGGDAGGKLVHFDGPFVFTADDLLCATAEIMGKSTYGTVYKATLEDGNQVAVKRLREKIAKNLKEFEAEVNTLGKIRHSNLLSLRAYYLGPKGEKLLVYDYMPKGSLASLLHARGPESPVNWHMRMKIALGATKGLLHLHTQENIIHGNLTSGNILIDENNNSRIADFGLSRLMTAAANSNVIATATALGYRAPELSKIKKANTKTDVYSLGVIILELLTGKSPGETMNGRDLPQWVASVVKEEWKNEVFDLELMKEAPGSGDEMLNTLKLALHCVDPSPTSRPEVQQIYQQLMDIKPDVASALSGEDEGQSSDTPATRNSGD